MHPFQDLLCQPLVALRNIRKRLRQLHLLLAHDGPELVLLTPTIRLTSIFCTEELRLRLAVLRAVFCTVAWAVGEPKGY